MSVEFIDSLAAITAAEWDGLWQSDYPFTRHAYLYALEQSGCTTRLTGWQPHHLILRERGRLVAAMPLYLKQHSYGEYVFDWSWADAYHRFGRDYYPKLVNAIPFTPATGPRFALSAGREEPVLAQLLEALREELAQRHLSGFHCLFPSSTHLARLQETQPQLQLRTGCQFHWFNHGFRDFDDFLQNFNARKRKSLKRERRKVDEQALRVQRVAGVNLRAADWQGFYQLYRRTYLKRSGHEGYLNGDFFERIGRALSSQLMMVKAFKDEQWVAGALYFHDSHQLYGRYWGARDEFDGLHFECCYYQGIEFAIETKLTRFDPGAQGEHKIQRGFTPVYTASLHWMAEQPFADAVGAFLRQEREHITHYCAEARGYLPFHEGAELVDASTLVGESWSRM